MPDTSTAASPTSLAEALTALFAAESVVVVGASSDETKLSGLALRNLRRGGFSGRIHAVNRRGAVIDGVATHRTIADIGEAVDAAIVMVPADDCPGAVRELGGLGVRTAVVAVSGFAELGTEEGHRRQRDLLDAARGADVRLVGPNGNGVYDTHRRLSLGYNHLHGLRLTPGNVALLSHSGAIAGSAVELLEPFGAGLSHFVSCGNQADLTLLDYAEFLLDDPHVAVFALVIDGVEDGARFRALTRAARAAGKAVIVLKLGDSAVGRRATLAHSARLSGSRAVYEAVSAADGVVQVPSLTALMVTAGLAGQGRTSTRTGAVVTSPSGGAAIAMADALDRVGVELPPLDEATGEALAPTARFATVMNPFDLGAAGGHNAHANVPLLARAAGVGVLNHVVTILQTELGQRRYAEAVATAADDNPDLAVLVTALAPLRGHEAETFRAAGVPVAPSTADAADVMAALRDLAVANAREADHPTADTRTCAAVAPTAARATGATRGGEHRGPSAGAPTAADVRGQYGPPGATQELPDLAASEALRNGLAPDEAEAKQLLATFGVPVPDERVVAVAEAAEAADRIAYPVVVKALARGLAHKSDYGLVTVADDAAAFTAAAAAIRDRLPEALDTDGPADRGTSAARALLVAECAGEGCEVNVGLIRDPEFGLLAVVGPGGTGVELVGELHHLALPTTAERVREVLGRGVLGRLLAAHRGAEAADVDALVEVVLALAAAAPALAPLVDAVELNPVRVGRGAAGGALALDALIAPRTTPPPMTEPTVPDGAGRTPHAKTAPTALDDTAGTERR